MVLEWIELAARSFSPLGARRATLGAHVVRAQAAVEGGVGAVSLADRAHEAALVDPRIILKEWGGT